MKRFLWIALSSALMVSCGGGGDDSDPATLVQGDSGSRSEADAGGTQSAPGAQPTITTSAPEPQANNPSTETPSAPTGGTSGAGSKPSLKQSDIVGLWDASQIIGGAKDEKYWHIDSFGNLKSHDYQGDAYDRGLNCYERQLEQLNYKITVDTSGAAKLTLTRTDTGKRVTVSIDMEVLDNRSKLHVDALDFLDLDKDGDFAENKDVILPKVVGIDVNDLQPRCSAAPTPTPTPDPRPVYQCGTKKYCKDMRSCAEARYFLNQCGVTRLDRDGDGVPCESLCKR